MTEPSGVPIGHTRIPRSCTHALVIDDDESILYLIGEALGMEGVHCALARSAREAIDALGAGYRPSAILLDLLLPDMSGELLLQWLRQHPATRSVPVIAMSASPLDLQRLGGKPDARLAKPFRFKALYETLAQLCGAGARPEGAGPVD